MGETLRFELRHKEIIDRIAVLSRTITPDEMAFLCEPGPSF